MRQYNDKNYFLGMDPGEEAFKKVQQGICPGQLQRAIPGEPLKYFEKRDTL